MAEVKNSFIKSKMNKDLDARLLPNGEYREGINIQVSRSEGADVGALENVLGNKLILDLVTKTGISGLECIGMYTDDTNNNIYLFLTDYTATNIATITGNNQRQFNAASLNYYEGANNFIYLYNTSTNTATMLVRGAFLNFSTTNSILSVNILEDLLFWTDNRNQPRRINVQFANTDAAITNPTYYTTEDQISVASYNPYPAIDLYYLNSDVYNTNGGQGTVLTTQLGIGTDIILDPASLIGINPEYLIGAVVTGTNIPTGATIHIYAGTTITLDTSTAVAVTAGTVLTFNANQSTTTYVTSMLDVSSPFLPNGTDINPDYNANYSGDPDYLEDKFVRFSYRFKFEDGEVSIMAPFTQATFIPKQDGYFLGADTTGTPTPVGNTTDEDSTYRTTIVEFMENKVNQILLQIPLPSQGKSLNNDFKVSEIEILYKESDGLAVKIVDTISSDGNQGFGMMPDPSNPVDFIARTTESVTYSYQGIKPYKTLPEQDLIRVYDKVPVRALSQEIISNRVVYGNFQNKHTPPNSLEFNVGIFDKYNFNIGQAQPVAEWYTSIVEYPMHTVKQNRNYQVGIVLSDKFGRSSTTILSSKQSQGVFTDPISGDPTTFQGGTIYHPYEANPGLSGNKVNSWPGDSIKILFNQAIGSNGPIAGVEPNLENFWPGIYNGDITSEYYNPLGWYSYKVVVKQQEQEYYNVYLPGILNGYPNAPAAPPDPANTINFITLFGDNIDKVPADMTGVGPDQKQYRSGVQLYGRVTPESVSVPSPTNNTQFYPGILANNTIAIANQDSIFGTVVDYLDVYQTESNPPVGRVSQSDVNNPIGSDPQPVATTTAYNFLLGVYETAPVESVIDIYWETSTSGLISELNEAINAESGGIVGFDTTDGTGKWVYFQDENIIPGQSVNTRGNTYDSLAPFYPIYGGGSAVVNSIINLTSVIDGAGRNRTTEFQLNRDSGNGAEGQDTYNITITTDSFFYYGQNANIDETYTFTFEITDLDEDNLQTTLLSFGSLQNVDPRFTNCLTTYNNPTGQELIYSYDAVNGSADPSRNTEDLTFAIVEQIPALPLLTIDQQGQLKDPATVLNGAMTVEVSVTDAAGAVATCTTALNGSVGYRTLPLNDDFYTCGNKSIGGGPLIINKASESSGFYWTSDYTTNINGDVIPGTGGPAPVINREPVSGLSLPNSLTYLEGTTGTDTLSVVSSCSTASTWSWVNTNRTATASVTNDFESTNSRLAVLGSNAYDGKLTFNNPIGITTGTAYIIVDFEVSLLNGVTLSDAPGLIWPTYLQYRVAGTSTWENVTDIEGTPVVFGQTQINDWTISKDGNGPFNDTGVINDRTKSESTDDGTYDKFNAAESYTYGRGTGVGASAPTLKAVCRQLFAVGMCQAYRNQTSFAPVASAPDKIGDYRLTVRYPSGRNQVYSTAASGWADGGINPAISIGYCPTPPYDNYTNAQQTQQVKLQFGDFYNPFQLGYKQNELSYSYRVSTNGSVDISNAEALSTPGTNVVYAREWAFKYVSRFYLDSKLTQPWEPGTVGNSGYNGQTADLYYSFISNEKNKANPEDGNDYSNVEKDRFTKYSETRSRTSSSNDILWADVDRKWVAEFTKFGIKVKSTALPLQRLSEGGGDPIVLPTGAIPVIANYSDGGQTVYMRAGNVNVAPANYNLPELKIIFESSEYTSNIATDAQNYASMIIAEGSLDPSGENPIAQNITQNWWLGLQDDYQPVTELTFHAGGNSSLTYSLNGDVATITITNCRLSNEVGIAPQDYYVNNPNA